MGDGNPSPSSSLSLFISLVGMFCAILSPNPTATQSSDHRLKPLGTGFKLDLSLLKVGLSHYFVTVTHSTFDRFSGSGSP